MILYKFSAPRRRKMIQIESAMTQKHGVDLRGKGVEVLWMGLKHRGESSGGEEIIVSGPSPFDNFPIDCLSNIISFTSPQDACVAALVSKAFRAASNSDGVWEKFLPPDYSSIVPQWQIFSSKKKLYLALCDDPILFKEGKKKELFFALCDEPVPTVDGKKSSWLEKASGKRCIMLSKKPMWGYWVGCPRAMLEEKHEDLDLWLFEVLDGMSTRYLSPRTGYSVYIVFKNTNGSEEGLWHGVPVEGYVKLAGQKTSGIYIKFVKPMDRRREIDGWMESKVGEFFNDSSCDNVAVSYVVLSCSRWKHDLIIQRVELRPSKSLRKGRKMIQKEKAVMAQTHGVGFRSKGKEDYGFSSMWHKHGIVLSKNTFGSLSFDNIPANCISNIISFTTPRDACVAASVSKTFEWAVKLDSVWEKFLPPDYSSMIPQSRVFTSKKELYFALCHDLVPVVDGKKSLWLEKASGKRCIILSKKPVWGSYVGDPESTHWQWNIFPGYLVDAMAEVLNSCVFEVSDGMSTRYLSPRTRYSVYIVYKTKSGRPEGFWFQESRVEGCIEVLGLEFPHQSAKFGDATERRRYRERRDGWMEAELGEFFNTASYDDVEIGVVIIRCDNSYCKRGLIVQGVELRPAESP